MSNSSSPKTQAETFVAEHADYLFQDAHFFVEAAAATRAREVSHNEFQFADGSILVIDNQRCRTHCRAPVSAAA
jgi:hypothetical protein